MTALVKKLKSKDGFTLVEMLAAVVLLGFLVLVVGSGTSVAMRVYNETIRYSESCTISATILGACENELRFAYDIRDTDGNVNAFTSNDYGEDTRFELEDGMVHVVSRSGNVLLLGEKVYTNGLRVSKFSVKINEETPPYGKMITVNIQMNDGNGVTAEILNVNG